MSKADRIIKGSMECKDLLMRLVANFPDLLNDDLASSEPSEIVSWIQNELWYLAERDPILKYEMQCRAKVGSPPEELEDDE